MNVAMQMLSRFCARLRAFSTATGGNLAVILALSAIPLTLAIGAGVDYARALVAHSNIADSLDAAALAVGAASNKPTSCSSDGSSSSTTGNGSSGSPTPCAPYQLIAQQYFKANFTPDPNNNTVPTIGVSIANEAVTLSVTNYNVPTTFLSSADTLMNSHALDNIQVSANSTVVWGQTKLWVSLVLDNSGSMAQNGKMAALQSASQTLLTTLQNASNTPGDVEVGIVPFTNEVSLGTATTTAAWIDWSNWSTKTWGGETAEVPAGTTGPGDDCPYSYGCRTPNGTSSASTINSTGTTKGYICPDGWSSQSDGTNGHIFMGCYTSVAASGTTLISGPSSRASCSGYSTSNPTNCTCSGTNSNKKCYTKNWTHPVWVPETNHALWAGCVTDRTQDYDIQNTQPSGNAAYLAENNDNCPTPTPGNGATVTSLGYDWTSLSGQISDMVASGSTNQAIGIAHGWQMVTPGNPYSTPTVPANTTRYIILLSDGLNTQDRLYGNGSTENTSLDANIDAREKKTCDAAKADGVVIYTLYVNINGSDGDSAPLQYCATDTSKYYVITASADIAAAFADIAAQITNLRVSK